MASALTVLFLGCWLAGQSGVSGRGYLWGTGGTDWTQQTTTTAPNHPGSAEPGTESGCTKSPSTPPETGRTDSTQLGTTPASTHPLRARPSTRTGGRESSSNQPWKQPHPGGPTNWVAFLSTGTTKPPLRGTGGLEPSPAPGLTRPIIAGVSAAAAGLLLLLLMAFVRYRRTRGRKGPAPRQRSTSPLGVLKTPAQEDPVYSNIDDGKEMQTLEPDSGTYAELDRQTLQPNVYDMINMSQGVPQ